MITPVDPDKFHELLKETNYDPDETNFVVDGFRHGFSLGYESKGPVKVTSHNLKLHAGDEIDLWNKVMKEVGLKRYAGPFSTIPAIFGDNFIQSPIGLVPKDNGSDTRLIFCLSHPRGEGSTSVNANTPASICSVEYPDFSDAD